jgi:hypothetical protein
MPLSPRGLESPITGDAVHTRGGDARGARPEDGLLDLLGAHSDREGGPSRSTFYWIYPGAVCQQSDIERWCEGLGLVELAQKMVYKGAPLRFLRSLKYGLSARPT